VIQNTGGTCLKEVIRIPGPHPPKIGKGERKWRNAQPHFNEKGNWRV
jgi:hypothetical protein